MVTFNCCLWCTGCVKRLISNDGSTNATERVLERLSKYTTNAEFLDNLNRET